MGEAKRFSVSEACGRLTFNRRLDQRNRDAHARFKLMKVRSIDRSAIDRRSRDVHARQDDEQRRSCTFQDDKGMNYIWILTLIYKIRLE